MIPVLAEICANVSEDCVNFRPRCVKFKPDTTECEYKPDTRLITRKAQ